MINNMINNATLARTEDTDRKGDWITTYLGGRYYCLDPRPEEVFIENIAHGLSLLVRYNGQITRFYSVAEHCYLLSYSVPPEYALQALLHDAEEGMGMGDMCRPLKHQPEMTIFRELCALNQKVIFAKFGVEYPESSIVQEFDARIVADEIRVLFDPPQIWCPLEPLGVTINGWSPEVAEKKFLERFYELYEN